jgi:hypothetical protein
MSEVKHIWYAESLHLKLKKFSSQTGIFTFDLSSKEKKRHSCATIKGRKPLVYQV